MSCPQSTYGSVSEAGEFDHGQNWYDCGGVYIYVCVLKKGKFFQRKTRGKMQERIFVICEM